MLARAAREVPEEAPDERMVTRVRRRLAPGPMDRERLAYLGRHLASAIFALCCLAYVLPRVPFYPKAAIVPLVVFPTFLALIWPFGGGVVTLAALAPPFFAYGAGWGVIYLVPAAVTMGLLRWKGREWATLLPGAVPVAVAWGLGLVLLPLAGALLRRWGALAGFLSGVVLTVTGGIAGWTNLPFTFNPGPGASLAAAKHAASPWTVLMEIARFLDSRPELAVQIVLFTIFSLPLYLWSGGSRDRRMWGAASYLIALFLTFVLLPILAMDVPVQLGPFLVSFGPCAIIAFLLTLLISSEHEGRV
jgi:hypothetical protein